MHAIIMLFLVTLAYGLHRRGTPAKPKIDYDDTDKIFHEDWVNMWSKKVG